MKDLEEKIDRYVHELYEDLGLVDLPEEKKADIFARVEEHLHKAIINESRETFSVEDEFEKAIKALEQNDYEFLDSIFIKYPEHRSHLLNIIDSELDKLKQIIKKEQKDAE